MIHMFQMTQFVDNDIIPYLLRAQHGEAIEIKVAQRRAAAPSCALSTYCYAPVSHTDQISVMCSSLRQIDSGLLGELFQLTLAEGRQGGAYTD